MLRLAPRLAIAVTAGGQLLAGDALYGVFCLVALVLTLVPAIAARRFEEVIPLEIELALLWLMVADMTLGNWLGMYQLGWYDKALHFSSSALIAMIGFLAVYVVHLTQHTRFLPWLDGVAILFVTLGVGAVWELAEYGVDELFTRRSQGAPNMSALDDTMFDLLLDAIGASIGAILGPLYIRYSHRSRRLMVALAELVKSRRQVASPFASST